MPDKVRRLNKEGLKQFEDFLEKKDDTDFPTYLLDSNDTSENADVNVKVEKIPFENRFELGQFLVDAFKNCDLADYSRDEGLWGWLALYYFDILCPEDREGKRKILKSYSYILSNDFRHYYRHLVRGPWLLVKDHGTNALVLLSNPLPVRGELYEQLASRQEIAGSEKLMTLVSALYLDQKTQKPKKGTAARSKPGSVDRLADISQQFLLTYDLQSMNKDTLIKLLPKEFDRWFGVKSEKPKKSFLQKLVS